MIQAIFKCVLFIEYFSSFIIAQKEKSRGEQGLANVKSVCTYFVDTLTVDTVVRSVQINGRKFHTKQLEL